MILPVKMDLKFVQPVKLAQESYPQPNGKVVKYGTAGFRQKLVSVLIDFILYGEILIFCFTKIFQQVLIRRY